MYIGIDNGLDGGIVGVNSDGTIAFREVMPVIKKGKGREVDTARFREILDRYNDGGTIIIEEASKHSAGVLALCSTWFTFGSLLTVIRLLNRRHEIVRPQTWQKLFWVKPKMAKGQKFDTKAAALNAVNRLWPGQDWTKSERASKPHDGMIDAALIAEFARRKNL